MLLIELGVFGRMRNRIKMRIRKFYRVFISLKGDPRKIAMGMAIGVFIGVTPTIPLHTGLVMLCILISRQNLAAALLGTWISNPLTVAFFYWAQYELGCLILRIDHAVLLENGYRFEQLLHAGWKILIPLQLGGLILAPFFAIPAYYLTYRAVMTVRRKKAHASYCERSAPKI